MKTLIRSSMAVACLFLAASCIDDEHVEHRDHDHLDYDDHHGHTTTTTTTEETTVRNPYVGTTVERETVRRY